jgi:hypothetical protein
VEKPSKAHVTTMADLEADIARRLRDEAPRPIFQAAVYMENNQINAVVQHEQMVDAMEMAAGLIHLKKMTLALDKQLAKGLRDHADICSDCRLRFAQKMTPAHPINIFLRGEEAVPLDPDSSVVLKP